MTWLQSLRPKNKSDANRRLFHSIYPYPTFPTPLTLKKEGKKESSPPQPWAFVGARRSSEAISRALFDGVEGAK